MDFHAFAGNVDLIWDEPDWGPLLTGFTEFARVILHDRRGSGASTRNVPPPNLETRATDLLAVFERWFRGASTRCGGVHRRDARLFAATYPDRTSGSSGTTRVRDSHGLPTIRGGKDRTRSRQPSSKQRTGARPTTRATWHSPAPLSVRESRTASDTR